MAEDKKTCVSKKEFYVYGVAALGQGMIYAAMSSYVSDFYISVMGLAPLYVMLLMLCARVWDAINDPIMGMIADRSNFRNGKYKPYILFSVIPIAVLTFLMFYIFDFSKKGSANYNETGTYVYVAVIYVLWGMLYTMGDIPFWSLPNSMTTEAPEREKIIGFARTLNGIGSSVPMALIMLLGYFNVSYENRYMIMAIVSSICGGLLLASSYITTKERVKIPKPIKETDHINPLKLIFRNKQMMAVILMGILSSGRYMFQAAAIHVSRYTFYMEGMEVLKSQSTIQLIFSLCTAAGMFSAMLACPFLIKKINYKKLAVISCCVGGTASVIAYFVGILTSYNIWSIVPFLFIASLPLGILNIVSYAMVGDCIDKIELDTGKRPTGLGSSCQSFVNKLGNALSTTMIIAMYIIVGFNVSDMAAVSGKSIDMINASTLDDSIRRGMFMLVTLIPGLSMFLCCIPMFFYDLTGKKKEIMLEELRRMRELRENNANV